MTKVQEWLKIVEESICQKTLWNVVFSHKGSSDATLPYKIAVRPILEKGKYFYQATNHFIDKVTHQNIRENVLLNKLKVFLETPYLQVLLETSWGQFHLVRTKSGYKLTIKEQRLASPSLDHNKFKNHILPEGVFVKSLGGLGIMDQYGKVFPNKRDKFYQINRFLELIQEIFENQENKEFMVVDFGCGKAYLTFALMEMILKKNLSVKMLGIDRKKEVVENNNRQAQELGFSQMSFIAGNIDDPLPCKKIDVTLSLHACDTATDDAILQGLKYNSDWILVAPCCQHELFHQIKTPSLQPLLKHGILKERISSLLTDAIRASILEAFGYQVDVIEFVDTEHTPKNILIRAKKISDSFSKEKYEKCLSWIRELGVAPYILEHMEKIF